MSSLSNPVSMLLLSLISRKAKIETFFSDSPSCLIMFRLVPEISKNLLIRVIKSTEKGKILSSELKNHDFFINTEKKDKSENSNDIGEYIYGLTELKILEKVNEQNYKINELFYETMKKLLSEGLDIDKKNFHRKAKGYEKYLEKGINKFYKFMNEKIFDQIGRTAQDSEINNFLVHANFLKKEQDKFQKDRIYTFLKKTEELINSFFYKYLVYNIQKKILDEKKFQFFQLLFYLATIEPGSYFTEFPDKYYDPSFDKHLDFMNQIGFLIIKTENKNSKIIKKYFCTPLIQSLFEENNNISEDFALLKYGDENANRFLYVETNMKFYAFMPEAKKKKKERQTSFIFSLSENFSTSSILEKDTKDEKNLFYINLFKNLFKIEMILPENGLIGYITRENIKNIIKNLKKSDKLLQFLSDHMSLNYDDVTTVNGTKYLINESVVNQILVLENEIKSVEVYDSVKCFYSFEKDEEYDEYEQLLNEFKQKKIPIFKEQKTPKKIIVIPNK